MRLDGVGQSNDIDNIVSGAFLSPRARRRRRIGTNREPAGIHSLGLLASLPSLVRSRASFVSDKKLMQPPLPPPADMTLTLLAGAACLPFSLINLLATGPRVASRAPVKSERTSERTRANRFYTHAPPARLAGWRKNRQALLFGPPAVGRRPQSFGLGQSSPPATKTNPSRSMAAISSSRRRRSSAVGQLSGEAAEDMAECGGRPSLMAARHWWPARVAAPRRNGTNQLADCFLLAAAAATPAQRASVRPRGPGSNISCGPTTPSKYGCSGAAQRRRRRWRGGLSSGSRRKRGGSE